MVIDNIAEMAPYTAICDGCGRRRLVRELPGAEVTGVIEMCDECCETTTPAKVELGERDGLLANDENDPAYLDLVSAGIDDNIHKEYEEIS